MAKISINKFGEKLALGSLLVLSLFLGIALFSFNLSDGGWSSSYSENIQNIFGNFGAFSADFLFSIFGISAYAIPLGILYIFIYKTYSQYSNLKVAKIDYATMSLGLIGTILSLSLLFGIFFSTKNFDLPYTSSGILGLNLAYFLRTSLGTPIASLIGILTLMVSLAWFFRFSWLIFMDDLGALIAKLVFGKNPSSSASRFLDTNLDEQYVHYEEEAEFDREAHFSQPLFNTDGKLVKDAKPKIDMRDAHEFFDDFSKNTETKFDTEKDSIAEKPTGAYGDFLAKSQHIGTFTTRIPLSSVTQIDLAKADIEAVKKIIDEAVGFEYEAISASGNFEKNTNIDDFSDLTDEEILNQKLDKFDENFRFEEKDEEIDFEFPEDFFTSQEEELERKLNTKDADVILEKVENGEIDYTPQPSQIEPSFNLNLTKNENQIIENHTDNNDFKADRSFDDFENLATGNSTQFDKTNQEDAQTDHFDLNRDSYNKIELETKGLDDLIIDRATTSLQLNEADFNENLAEDEDALVEYATEKREPVLDDLNETNHKPKLEGAIMDRKTPPNFDDMSEDDKKAIKQPREFGYLNKSVPDADKMQNDADKLYRAIVQPREYGYIEEPVESLDKVQKDADTLYRAVSEPREYGYIEEPVSQLTKIQEIADKLYKAVSEPREHGYVEEPVEQLSKLQARIDQLYTAITQPREYGYLADTVPQIAQLQAYADELYIAITQPREHGYLEETVPQVQKLQDDIDKLYLAVTQPREHGYIDEPVESLAKVQKDTDDVINAVRGNTGKKLDAVDDLRTENSDEFFGHLPRETEVEFDNSQEFENSIFETQASQSAEEVIEPMASSSDFSQEEKDLANQENLENLENLNSLENQQILENEENQFKTRVALDAEDIQAPVEFSQFEQASQKDSENLQEFLESGSTKERSDKDLIEEQEQEQDTQEIEETDDGHKVWRVSDFQIKQADIEGDLLGTGALPSLEILDQPSKLEETFSAEEQDELIFSLKQGLEEFGVSCEVVEVLPGPVVTRFELELAAGVKSSKVSALDKDIARALKVPSVMVVEVTPGKSTVGVEIPNKNRSLISLRNQLASQKFKDSTYALPLALGEDISGETQVANLAKMPHLLVAGTTGSGKSVGINAMLLSLLYKLNAEQLRLILIDPKMLELAVYQGIPHLLAPVVTDMKQAANALNWCVGEMEERYKLMAAMGVKNIDGYNKRIEQAQSQGAKVLNPLNEEKYLEPMPYIVVVIDEFNDLMIMVGKKVEELIARLAQKARASGIHLILATQRPSVDVITGLIKANIPARIGFQVSTKIDSRTILDASGAEQLLGNGDSLYLSGNQPLPVRIHGAFVSDDEVYRVAEDWRRRGEPNYIDGVLTGESREKNPVAFDTEINEEQDELYDEVVEFVFESGRPSASAIQRRFSIGYPRAARLIDSMEANGLISALQSNGKREILTR